MVRHNETGISDLSSCYKKNIRRPPCRVNLEWQAERQLVNGWFKICIGFLLIEVTTLSQQGTGTEIPECAAIPKRLDASGSTLSRILAIEIAKHGSVNDPHEGWIIGPSTCASGNAG